MAGTRLVNSDLEVQGSIKLTTTPNNTGSILTKYTDGTISVRTPAQVKSDIGANFTAGSGLTLSGTTFSLPVTVSGSGNYVSNVAQTTNGITVTKATLPTTDITGLVPYAGANQPIDLNTQSLSMNGIFNTNSEFLEKKNLLSATSGNFQLLQFENLGAITDSVGGDSGTADRMLVIEIPTNSAIMYFLELELFQYSASSEPNNNNYNRHTNLYIQGYSNVPSSHKAKCDNPDLIDKIEVRRIDNTKTFFYVYFKNLISHPSVYFKRITYRFQIGSSVRNSDKSNFKISFKTTADEPLFATVNNSQFIRDSYLWNKGDFAQTNVDNWNTAFGWGNFRGYGLGITALTPATTLTSTTIDEPNLPSGLYHISGGQNIYFPFSADVLIMRSGINGYTTQKMQLVNSGDYVKMYLRHYKPNTSTWTPWREVITDENLDSQATSLGFIKSSALSGYVPTARTLTINGTTFDLSANRTWTVADTITRLRGTASGTYTSGDLTLLAGTGIGISQSGENITVTNSSPNVVQNLLETLANGNMADDTGYGGEVIQFYNPNTDKLNSIYNDSGSFGLRASVSDGLIDFNSSDTSWMVWGNGMKEFQGITGDAYYAANYTDNTYVQKKYVDDRAIRLRVTTSGAFTSGDFTLIPGTGIGLSQIGVGTDSLITISNQSPNATHTGDVTGATALTIATSAVTHAKYQNIPTQRILGRGATGTGNVQELTLGSNLSLSTAGVLSATNTVYSLPVATATVLGGIELFSNTVQTVTANAVSTQALRTYGVQLNSAGQAVVNVPWTDNDSPFEIVNNYGNRAIVRTGRDSQYFDSNNGNNAIDFSYADGTDSGLGTLGDYTFATGLNNIARGTYSSVFGSNNVTASMYSTAFGCGNSTHDHASFVIGQYANTYSEADGVWTPGSKIFTVGNGTATSLGVIRSNAYVLNNDGTSVQYGIASYNEDYSSDFTDNSIVTKKYTKVKTYYVGDSESYTSLEALETLFILIDPDIYLNIPNPTNYEGFKISVKFRSGDNTVGVSQSASIPLIRNIQYQAVTNITIPDNYGVLTFVSTGDFWEQI